MWHVLNWIIYENENCFKQKSVFDGCLILSSIIICFENYFRPPLQIDRLNPWWTVPDLGTGGQWFDFKWASNIFKHSNRLKSFNVNTLRKQTFHPTLFLIRNLFLSWPFCAYDFNVIKWRTSKPHFQFVSTLFQPSYEPLSPQEEWLTRHFRMKDLMYKNCAPYKII